MNIYEAFQDKDLDEEGKWFDLGPKSRIKLLYMGSEKARRKHENLMRPYAQRQKMGIELTEEESQEVNSAFLSECIVLDWEGIKGPSDEEKDDDGNPKMVDIPYSKETVAAVTTALPRFTAMILRLAMDEANFEKELADAEEGN